MKAVVLLSGGIDSPVAGYLIGKKGAEIVGVHSLMGNKWPKKINELCKKITDKPLKLYGVPHSETLKEVISKCDRKYTCLICKRFMYRYAEKIAEKEGAKFVVTGENLGQVASQTLENLEVIDASIETPIVRPLIAFDKEDVIRIAKEIDTYDISIKDVKPCEFVPDSPATQAREMTVIREEQKLDVDGLVEKAIKNSKQKTFK